jgi:hypothetical protein
VSVLVSCEGCWRYNDILAAVRGLVLESVRRMDSATCQAMITPCRTFFHARCRNEYFGRGALAMQRGGRGVWQYMKPGRLICPTSSAPSDEALLISDATHRGMLTWSARSNRWLCMHNP